MRRGMILAVLLCFVVLLIPLAGAWGQADGEVPEMGMNQLLGTGLALGSGFLTKFVSKKKNSIVYKIGSPVAAVLGGMGAAWAMGQGSVDFSTVLKSGLQFGMQAVFTQSAFSGVRAQVKGQF